MPMRTSASMSGEEPASRHFAWVRCSACPDPMGDTQWPQWLAACYHVTPHLQRFGHDVALLDLGKCTDEEAQSVVQALLARLQRQQVHMRIAVAPSGMLAQLALLHMPADEPWTLLPAQGTPNLLRASPTAALTHLQFAEQASITAQALAQAVSKLEEYGVGSLAHLARFDDSALRRQFGARLGAVLAHVARGEDPAPFQPTPAPLRLQVRLRMAVPLAADELLDGLASLALEMASTLTRRGLHAQRLEVQLRWEDGAEEDRTHTVPQPLIGARVIEAVARRLLTPVLQGYVYAEAPRLVDGFRLIVSQLTPRYPAQDSFWPQRVRRLDSIRALADVLTQRYGKPLLFQTRLTAPDAIFEQERSRLAPVQADAADTTAMLEEQASGVVTPDVPEKPTTIPHGIHWW